MGEMKYSAAAQECIDKIEKKRQEEPLSIHEDCQKLLQLAEEEDSQALLGLGYYYFGYYYLEKVEVDRSMFCLLEAVKYLKNTNQYYQLASAYNTAGVAADSQGNRTLALEYFSSCIQYSEKYGFPYVLAKAENNLGSILHNIGANERALELFEKSYTHCLEAEQGPYTSWTLLTILIGMGTCYVVLGKYKEAQEIESKIQALALGKEEREIPMFIYSIFKAELAKYRGDRALAINYIERVHESIRSGVNYILYSDNLENIARLLSSMGEYDRLLQILLSVQEWAERAENTPLESKWFYFMLNCYEHLRMEEEYIHIAEKYFKLYGVQTNRSREITRKALELQQGLLEIQEHQHEMMALNEELKIMFRHDSMTGLPNRSYLNEHLESQFEKAVAEKKILAVGLMDIDSFKQYNDFYGHQAGDRCIEQVAAKLKSIENEKIFCARYGGDEFIIVYYDMREEEIKEVADLMGQKMAGLHVAYEGSEENPKLTVSQGIAYKIPVETDRIWRFSYWADQLLYQAKKNGKNNFLIEKIME